MSYWWSCDIRKQTSFIIIIYTSLFTQSVATKQKKRKKSNNKDALSVSGALVARRRK